ncbi:MAG: SDR family oxidoreductase [Iodobacter sp.]
MQSNPLQNQTIVIIGGSSGLGLASARAAIASKARVIIGGSDHEKLQTALAGLGEHATGQTLNMLDPVSIQHFFDAIPALDHLLITAAVICPGSLLEAPIESLQANLDSRFWGSVHSLRAAAPRLAIAGSITLTSGMVTQRPQAGKSMAAVAAGAVETLAHSLVAEIAPRRINVINPGPMHTPLLTGLFGSNSAQIDALANAQPLKRLGMPEDFADAALFLMRNPNINGEVLHLNGGSSWA